MGLFENFPYTNFHELNLDWVIETMKKIDAKVSNMEQMTKEEVQKVLNGWIASGEIDKIIAQSADEVRKELNDFKNDMFTYPYKGRVGVFIGDSFTYGTGLSDRALSYPNLMCNALGIELDNYAVAGSGYVDPDPNGGTFYTQLDRVKNRYLENTDNITFICIMGGFNDINNDQLSPSQLYSNCSSFLGQVQTAFPNVPVIWAGLNVGCNTEMGGKFKEAMDFVANVPLVRTPNSPIHRCSNWQWALHGKSQYFTDDLIHPNALGHQIISGFLLNAILGGSMDYKYMVVREENPIPYTGWKSEGTFSVEQDNDIVRVKFPTIITPENSTTPIADYTLNFTIPEAYRPTTVQSHPVFTAQGLGLAVCIFDNGTVHMRALGTRQSVSINSNQSIRFTDFEYPMK